MEGLVKPVHFVCVCLILVGTIVLAQFGSNPPANPSSGLPFAQQLQPGQPPNLSPLPQGVPFAQRQSGHSRRRNAKAQVQNGPEQILYTFQGGSDGQNPGGGLIFDSSGNLYGTTEYGGDGACTYGIDDGCGTVFELSHNGNGGWTETILYSFQCCTDGNSPDSGLIFDQAGNLYGTTAVGGTYDQGTVFELTPNSNGGWTETLLYSFSDEIALEVPQGVIFDQKGNLYGTASEAGECGHFATCGGVFELSPSTNEGWTETSLYTFQPSGGWGPSPGLVVDRVGNLYGTTYRGGSNDCNVDENGGCGTVFELSPNGSGGWSEITLYSFQGGSDGASPEAGLIFDQSGNLYGTTQLGGGTGCSGTGCGTVFELSPIAGGGWTENVLYSFEAGGDGNYPEAGLIFDDNGNLYSTSGGGDSACLMRNGYGCGTVFEFSPNGSGGWTELSLYKFQAGNDGEIPLSGLILDQTGNLYGTTDYGGATGCGVDEFGCGVVFEISRGAFAKLSPTSLAFGNETVGITTSPQVATLANIGNLPFNITSIQITGANSSDFAQTNNCPPSLGANSSCSINVTFTPTALGNDSASLVVADTAPGGVQTVALTGTGSAFMVTVSPSNLTFPAQYVGTAGLNQNVQLKNNGPTNLTISSVVASPSSDFSQLSTCGNSLIVGASCSIGVFFDPSTSGTRNGTLTINDNAPGSPQIVPLTGTGQDFTLAPSSSSTATVAPGQAAKYTVAVAPGGGFNQSVTLSCTGAPAKSSCAVSPSSVTLNGAASAPIAVTVTTAGTSASLAHPSDLPPGGDRLALWLAFSGLPGLVLLGSRPRRQHGRTFYGVALLCVLFITMTWSACGGGDGTASGGGSGTPAGTYNLTVMGTFSSGSANLVHSTKLTLVVQ
jgi:uncharacterized repeat protein (TIGR03803 family)